jgi:hypothetical protein
MMFAYVSLFAIGTLGMLAARSLVKPRLQPARVRAQR